MAERGSCGAGSDTVAADGEVGMGSVSRMVTLRPAPRPGTSAPTWAAGPTTGAWRPEATGAASVESVESLELVASAAPVLPPGVEVPFEPDPEAAAFLNAPRRPLSFYVAPFGTPPFGNPPPRVVPGSGSAARGGANWGPAYPAGA
ncbi:hypothetical protein WCD74_14080 [Actinomycetospora sp. OC33-EN08]|uniref:Uncharacterized protein n=1 Tax=Actinomycetospora aurantiaca TaxID=3129233 RepID=A0ABU8MPP1_9PSEU